MKRSIITAALALGLLASAYTPARAECGFGIGLGLGFSFSGFKSGCGQGNCGPVAPPCYPPMYPPMFGMPYPYYPYNPMFNYGMQQPHLPPLASTVAPPLQDDKAAKPIKALEKKEGKLADGTAKDE
ncbi:MAG: hypothetical protein U0736_11900 [Gemmataceae bacterium]